MAEATGHFGRLPAVFTTPGISSFSDFLTMAAPDLAPGRLAAVGGVMPDVPHGTTIVSAVFEKGVVMAGDRRATMGNIIAQRDIEKVFQADEFSAVGIAGTAGIAIEMVRLFQVELQHYEKLEGTTLSLDGKANRLAAMIRNNLGLAMQGLAVVPLFAGFDVARDEGRIYSYDVTGGRYEQHSFHSVGSGSMFARGALKKTYRDDLTVDETVRACVGALYDAADDDSATGGPDITRKIYPVVVIVDADGFQRLADDEIGAVVTTMLEGRMITPGGPHAPLD